MTDLWADVEEELGALRLPRAYCPIEPTLKQEWFLRRDELEAFFGGAAGPGKSWGLLMAALQYVDVPGYHGLLLRPTLTEFEQPGGLIEVSHDWLGGTDAWWHGGDRSWTFPSGATIRFGYLANVNDLSRYKGPSYSFCGFDELTGFTYNLYRGMFRVLRQAIGVLDNVPLRMRGASNPGDVGHTWVKARFIKPETREKDAVFVPAKIQDNPHMDYVVYLKSLAHMTPLDQERLIRGDWDVTEEGGKFHREKFQIVPAASVLPAIKSVRYWDLAGTEPNASNADPDYTAGLLLQIDKHGTFTIMHLVHERVADHIVEQRVAQTAHGDGRLVPVYIERDPGQAGKAQVNHYKRNVLRGFIVHEGSTRVAGRNAAKEIRARPVAAAVGNDLVQIVETCPHLLELLDECSIFPNGQNDDIVDSLSGAHTALTSTGTAQSTISVPRARIPGVSDRTTSTVRR